MAMGLIKRLQPHLNLRDFPSLAKEDRPSKSSTVETDTTDREGIAVGHAALKEALLREGHGCASCDEHMDVIREDTINSSFLVQLWCTVSVCSQVHTVHVHEHKRRHRHHHHHHQSAQERYKAAKPPSW
ncbi:uncharacterized protein TRIREDRAFT_105707 [Trichoderma reesei QM6a]|uniref:Predicted protein n=2 Tax=Hypocrea jecorina TaxID=51453 RepID=G0REE9_HYPJQ|nr:uncharacterized protein TRIREDRAFT_105707 [Trichoderma reesei QM6a]EGR50257.1 predicted protein [Trichoderma reesei QM6a]ETS04050.1 hypothetical protein M419DRAFT_74493 [Trichoderma reesei RUT C-30]